MGVGVEQKHTFLFDVFDEQVFMTRDFDARRIGACWCGDVYFQIRHKAPS